MLGACLPRLIVHLSFSGGAWVGARRRLRAARLGAAARRARPSRAMPTVEAPSICHDTEQSSRELLARATLSRSGRAVSRLSDTNSLATTRRRANNNTS